DTQKPIEIHKGTIMRSNITSIEKGNSGTPGEKQVKFSLKENQIGSITKNTPYGVFGKLDESLSNGISDEPMPIGLSHEVEEGPAKILTVVEGEEVEEFDVEIVNSISQTSPATKGMIVKITDDKLLDETGGIVQGMSGSPIIQTVILSGQSPMYSSMTQLQATVCISNGCLKKQVLTFTTQIKKQDKSG